MRWIIVVIMLVFICPVRAQEFSFLGGTLRDTETHESSYSWQYEYMQGLGEPLAFSLSYLNEGHLPDHHRDGHTGQLWARVNMLDRRLSLAVGVGPYYYSDTTRISSEDPYINDHGWGIMASLAATWYTENRWLFRLRANGIETDGMETLSVLLGIGYQLESPPSPGPLVSSQSQDKNTTHNEITIFSGVTIVNSFSSEPSTAVSIEYRRSLWRYLDWTIAWIDEGDNDMIDRNGFASQLWLGKRFCSDHLTLGFGGGVYGASDNYSDEHNEQDNDNTLSGIITLTGSYRFHPNWGIRASWNRILTDYDRDTDVILCGISYLF
ncbi:MAG: hypothetical protein PHR77_15755 [Kiritimatiellae bacterium]|nr:hypothetical protein [Kiritimatiellia bacterium]MDD5519765.1 hypothetical protein [Kiritimatiellia bacterium]